MEKIGVPNVSNFCSKSVNTLPEEPTPRITDIPTHADTEVPLVENLHKLGSRTVRFSLEDTYCPLERIVPGNEVKILKKDDTYGKFDFHNSGEIKISEESPPLMKGKIPAQNGATFKSDATAQKSEMKVINSSEYLIRASAMRNKIEEKITEIENKMNLPNSDLNPESIESYSSPPDYNMIKVLDMRRSRSCSVSEMRQNTIDRLQSNLEKAEKDLELREEEVAKLRKIRDEVGSEIEDLTASLFEEANNIVKKAHLKQQKAERSAKEANMKLGMLQEEVRALKAIVESTKMYSPGIEASDMVDKRLNTYQREAYEVDPIFNKEFITWRQNPNFNKEDPFFVRIYKEDILPCLSFKNKELAENVLSAIEEDKMIIEKITTNKNEPLPNSRSIFGDIKKRRRITSAKLGLVDDIIE